MSSPSTAAAALSPATPRLKSVDVFRGATIAAMILVNAQFSPEDSYRQLAHAAWHGWTFADVIFPSFLFIVGVSLTLSTASRVARGEDRARLFGHALRRSLLIFGCGVAIDYLRVPTSKFPFIGLQDHLQLTGVLQKIAVCYLVAFIIYHWTGLRGVIFGIIGLNLLYLGLLYFYPVPGCGPGSLDVNCNFPGYLDEIVLDGFRWSNPTFDPDGLGAILPAITSVLFGVLGGQFLRGNTAAAAAMAPRRGNCPDRRRRIARDVGTNQQAALDHLIRRSHGGSGGNSPLLHELARRWPPLATLVQTAGDLGVERDRGLFDISARGKRAAGARHGKIAVHRRPRACGEPTKRVPAVCDGGAGCRVPGGLAYESPGLVSEVLAGRGSMLLWFIIDQISE